MEESRIVIGLFSPIQVVQLKQFGCGLKVLILLMMVTETDIVGKYLEREVPPLYFLAEISLRFHDCSTKWVMHTTLNWFSL